jgi:hypothetical protein
MGPFLVTTDEVGGPRPALDIRCEVNGQVMQQDNTGDLLFDPVHLVRYVSTMIRLNPGDIIATGTPGGVGHARKPQVFLEEGDTIVTEIEGVGRLENRVVSEVRDENPSDDAGLGGRGHRPVPQSRRRPRRGIVRRALAAPRLDPQARRGPRGRQRPGAQEPHALGPHR